MADLRRQSLGIMTHFSRHMKSSRHVVYLNIDSFGCCLNPLSLKIALIFLKGRIELGDERINSHPLVQEDKKA